MDDDLNAGRSRELYEQLEAKLSGMTEQEKQAYIASRPPEVEELLRLRTIAKRAFEAARRNAITHSDLATFSAPPTLPGRRVMAVARFLLTKRAYETYVQPAIADMQFEYRKAWADGQRGMARWIVVRGYLGLAWPWLWSLITTVGGKLVGWIVRGG